MTDNIGDQAVKKRSSDGVGHGTAEDHAGKGPRVLEDRIITPVGKLEEVKAVSDGSKKHKLAEALLRGATIEHLMEVTGWNRSTTLSALRWDVGQMGLGCERKRGKYFLIIPEGLKRLPLRTADVTRADALVAACK